MPERVPTGVAAIGGAHANYHDLASRAGQFKDSPIGRLPQDWEVKPLDDLVDSARPISYGILMPGTGYPGGVPVIKVKDIVGDRIRLDELLLTSPAIDYEYRRSRVKVGDLLFTIRGTVGRMATVPPQLENANITQDTARIAVKGAPISFVRQYLGMPAPQHFIGVHTLGVAVQGINLRDVRRILIAVPPRIEAAKIAEILDTLDAAIHKTEQIITKLKQVKQGLLLHLLTRGLDDNGELRDPAGHPEQFTDTPLGILPRNWALARFGEVAESTTLGTAKRGADPEGDNLCLLKMGNLGWGELKLDDIELVGRSRVPDWKRLLLKTGDLLFNTRNTPELVGKTAAWRDDAQEVVPDNNILRVRFSKSINGVFVAAYMGNGSGRNAIGQLATGTTSVAAIYWKSLERLLIPRPSRQEQDRIVERIDCLDARIGSEVGLLDKYRLSKQGLMDDLLTGRVRVTSLLDEAVA